MGSKEVKEATTEQIKDYYNNDDFEQDDIYDIAVDTDKEDELFGYADIDNYYSKNKYNKLECFIQLKLEEESMRFIFADIDKRTVIQEGITHFEIIGGIVRNIHSSTPKAKLTFSKDTAQKLVNGIPIQYSGYIQQFALEFPTFLENQMAKTKKLQKF